MSPSLSEFMEHAVSESTLSAPILFSVYSAFFFFFNLFLAALGLRCCTWAFSICGEWGLLFIAVRGLLTAVASLVAKHGF